MEIVSQPTYARFLAMAAAEARAAYVAERRKFEENLTGAPCTWGDTPMPRWDGEGRDSAGRRHKAVWPKLAATATASGLTATTLVSARFAVSRGARAPTPADCMTQQSVDLARSMWLLQDDRLTGRLASDRQTELTAVGRQLLGTITQNRMPTPQEIHNARAAIVGLACVGLSPVYRHGLAESMQMYELASSLLLDAVRQYLEDPAGYDRVWGSFVSPQVRAMAETVKKNIQKGIGT